MGDSMYVLRRIVGKNDSEMRFETCSCAAGPVKGFDNLGPILWMNALPEFFD